MSKEFVIGERVRVVALPPYVKTAEPMPMLRPPDVIQLGEEGVVVDRRPGGFWSVRFARGIFLLDSQFIETVPAIADTESEAEANDERSHNVPLDQKYI
ncbi:regulatory protein SipA [Coleofasciculus sp. H7-2]|uniref:regulatory protein SipA n=1 Tax=Coleofasciculus sp. H7-2 TaxID=3351545 RepID=UPI0036705BF5